MTAASEICLLSNLNLFRQCQMAQTTLTTVAVQTSFSWELHFLKHIEMIDSMEVVSTPIFRIEPNHVQRLWAKLQEQNICWVVSYACPHRLQTETVTQLLNHRISSVGIRLCMMRHKMKDLDRGMKEFQITLHQGSCYCIGFWKRKAFFIVNSLEFDGDQTWRSSKAGYSCVKQIINLKPLIGKYQRFN